jgi:hypothetical protein
MKYQGLSLLLAVQIRADTKSIEAGHAEQDVAGTRQLRRIRNKSRKRVHLSFMQHLEGALTRKGSTAIHAIDYYIVDIM